MCVCICVYMCMCVYMCVHVCVNVCVQVCVHVCACVCACTLVYHKLWRLLIGRLHTFVWHGNDPNNKTRKIPGAHTFNKLRVIPDQFYYNCEKVSVIVYVLDTSSLPPLLPSLPTPGTNQGWCFTHCESYDVFWDTWHRNHVEPDNRPHWRFHQVSNIHPPIYH